MKKTLFRDIRAAVFVLLTAVSCNYDDAMTVPSVGIGVVDKSYLVSSDGGKLEIEVYANSEFHVTGTDSCNWIHFDRTSAAEDVILNAECDPNEGFRRKASFVICSDIDSRRDTVLIRQDGVAAILSMANTSFIVDQNGGVNSFDVETNVPFDKFTVNCSYPNGTEPWLSDIKIDIQDEESLKRKLIIATNTNTDELNPRSASVSFVFTDGWDETKRVDINLTQKNAKGEVGKEISFEDLFSEYADEKPIKEYLYFDGFVVSNTESGNAGDNLQTGPTAIDYSYSKRTVYIESIDGSKGLQLICATAGDNVFKQFSKVRLLVKDAVLSAKESPEYYTMTNVNKSMVISQEIGDKSVLPVKNKHLDELTDADIFTYVNVLDLEIPVRKGALVPVNGGISVEGNGHKVTKYPLLIRDIKGNTSYLMTNTVCVYRNDGTCLPYGSGSISGVIVSEQFAGFEWRTGADIEDMAVDPTLGYIGKYQIRHQCKEDIYANMSLKIDDSFSALLTEFRFWNPDGANHVSLPTYGENGWFTHTCQTKYTMSETKNRIISKGLPMGSPGMFYSYLGPMGFSTNKVNIFGVNKGNKNGCGIILDTAKEHWCTTDDALASLVSTAPDGTVEWCGPYSTASGATSINSGGNSQGVAASFCAFYADRWWDSELGRPYAWLINFSTEGISTDNISLQLSMFDGSSAMYNPRHWRAQWAFTDSQLPEDDDKWHTAAEFTVQDVNTRNLYGSLTAFKYINVQLPLDILGKENVYVRVMPANDLCSDGSDYDNVHMSDYPTNFGCNSIEYIAVRYNK